MKNSKIVFVSIIIFFAILITFSPMLISRLHFKPEYSYTENPMASVSEEYAYADNETKFYMTAIKNSTVGIIGNFSEYYYENNLHTWIFKTEKVIYGEKPESIIKIVNPSIDYHTSENPIKPDTFKEGNSYILFLVKDESIFLNEPQYGLLGDTYIPINDVNSSTWARGNINFGNTQNSNLILNYYADLATTRGFNENRFIIESYSDKKLNDVVINSKVILKVNVKSKVIDAILREQSTYEVDILDILKGSEFVTDEDISFLINAYKNSLQTGKEYIITLSLCDNGEKHSVFTQSALNGIIPIEDKETVAEVYTWLGLKEPVTE